MDDFVLLPIVGPELYARVRQLDWRLSSFSASGRVKLGDLVIDTVAVEATFAAAYSSCPARSSSFSSFWLWARPCVHARAAPVARVGLPLHRQHAHGLTSTFAGCAQNWDLAPR